jgi:hypothetical protein
MLRILNKTRSISLSLCDRFKIYFILRVFVIGLLLIFNFIFCGQPKETTKEVKKSWDYNDITIENLFQLNEDEKEGIWAGSMEDLNAKLKQHYYFIFSYSSGFLKRKSKLVTKEQAKNICNAFALPSLVIPQLVSHFYPEGGRTWVCYELGSEQNYSTEIDSMRQEAYNNYTKYLKRQISIVTCDPLVDEEGNYGKCRCIVNYKTDIGQPSVKRDFVRIYGRCNKKEACEKYNVDCD